MTDKPTKPGFYWIASSPNPAIVVIYESEGRLWAGNVPMDRCGFTFLAPVEPLKYQPPKGKRG